MSSVGLVYFTTKTLQRKTQLSDTNINTNQPKVTLTGVLETS